MPAHAITGTRVLKQLALVLATTTTLISIGGAHSHPQSLAHGYADEIYGHVERSTSINQCLSNACCFAEEETCSLSAFKKDSTTLVFPGGSTRCIFSTSTPFSFQVIPGSTDKVLLYFQGGGACWDEISTNAGFCTTDSQPDSLVGVFDHSDAMNPYKDYTVVHVLYCSGDMHAGNVTRSYTDSAGRLVVQTGIYNVQSALDWIVAQQKSGDLASTLTDLVLMGCSAGSIGAQVWATSAMEAISWTSAAVIPDSYVGVFPPGTQGPLIYDFGMCSWLSCWASSSLASSCFAQTLTLQDITEYQISIMNTWAQKVPFSFIQSKADATQISFYVAIAALDPIVRGNITAEEFYAETNLIFERYNQYENFVHYFVDGSKHCFTQSAAVYTADTTGVTGSKVTGVQSMIDWIGLMPLTTSPVTTECYGQDLDEADWSGTTYCDSALQGKDYGP